MTYRYHGRKGQSWSTDLILGVVVFILIVTIFYSFANTGKKPNNDELQKEGEAIAAKLDTATGSARLPLIAQGAIDQSQATIIYNSSFDKLSQSLDARNKFCIYLEDQSGSIILISNKTGAGSSDLLVSGTPCGSLVSGIVYPNGSGGGPPDTIAPNITLTGPASGAIFNASPVTISGTAADNVNVSFVQVRINGGAWIPASGTTSWTFSAPLSPGSNLIEARSVDTSNNPSNATNTTITYVFVPPTSFVVFVPPTPANNTITSNATQTFSATASASVIALAYAFDGASTMVYDSSLVLMMGFNNIGTFGEGAVLANAYDASLLANNGTCTNMGTGCTFTPGKHGMAMLFDGVNDFVKIASSPAYNASKGMTISAWVRPDTASKPYMDILQKGWETPPGAGTSPWVSYELITDATGNHFGFGVSNQTTLQSTYGATPIVAGQWYHVVGTWNTTHAMLYVNGILDAAPLPSKGMLAFNTQPLYIGNGRYEDGTYAWVGAIDDVLFFNRSLSQAEITQLYRSSLDEIAPDTFSYAVNQTLSAGSHTISVTATNASGSSNSTGTLQITRI